LSDFVLDLEDRVVRVGDRIAYAATDGRSSGLRTGTVTAIIPAHTKYASKADEREGWGRDVPAKIRVQVDKSSGYWAPEKPVLIEAGFKRFVRLG
jgi:hypothetical protein